MRLCEIFDPNEQLEAKWYPSSHGIRCEVNINGRNFWIDFMEMGDGRWDLEFALHKNLMLHYGTTGAGDEIAVFSAVVNAVRKFSKRQQPKAITFSGDADRRSLYARLLSRFSRELQNDGYKVLKDTAFRMSPFGKKQPTDKEGFFAIVKQDVA